MDIGEMTIKEAMQTMTIGDAPKSIRIVTEIPKSLRMLRPKKDKQAMILVCVSTRNPLRTKLTMEEMGKAINLETEEEEEDLVEILVEEEEDKDMEVETEGADPLNRLPLYLPSWKGKARVSKDLDESKSSL